MNTVELTDVRQEVRIEGLKVVRGQDIGLGRARGRTSEVNTRQGSGRTLEQSNSFPVGAIPIKSVLGHVVKGSYYGRKVRDEGNKERGMRERF